MEETKHKQPSHSKNVKGGNQYYNDWSQKWELPANDLNRLTSLQLVQATLFSNIFLKTGKQVFQEKENAIRNELNFLLVRNNPK